MSTDRRKKISGGKKLESKACEVEQLFKKHYTLLCLVSFGILKDRDAAKDVVQDFFISYWQRRGLISLTVSFKAYAIRAVKNLSLLSLERAKKEKLLFQGMNVKDYEEQKISDESYKNQRLNELLNRLPKSRKDIFISFVVYGQSYSEIAENNGILINTVKTQMKRAEATQDLLYFFALFLSYFL
jgi:RNA polymerase sigma-70 factor (ECF subfamily)